MTESWRGANVAAVADDGSNSGLAITSALDSIDDIPKGLLRNTSLMLNKTSTSQTILEQNYTQLYELFNRMRQQDVMNNLALSVVFSVIVLVSMFGNSLVVYVIVRNKRMHTVTNAFITNLAVGDLLITFLNIPFNLVRYILNDWPFGDGMCHVINYVQTVSVYAFTFTLTSIALDRYRVIMYPLRPRISMCLALLIVTSVWILASILSIPFGLWYGQKTDIIAIIESTRCTKIFPSREVERYVYLATAITQYVIPLIIISAAYGRIAQRLWVRVTLGHVTQDQQASHMKSKKKTIKMLITVVMVFAVCWLPLNVYYLILHFPPPEYTIKHSGKAVFSCYWIAMTSVSVNPFIYCWFNEAFRAEVLNRFRCCFRKKRRIHPGYEIDGILVRSDQVRTRSHRWLRGSTAARTSSLSVKGPLSPSREAERRVPRRENIVPIFQVSSAGVEEELTEYSPISDQTTGPHQANGHMTSSRNGSEKLEEIQLEFRPIEEEDEDDIMRDEDEDSDEELREEDGEEIQTAV